MICECDHAHRPHFAHSLYRIHLYFLRVQAFLPLFHRPQFYQKYVSLSKDEKYVNLTKESAFLLYAMMALSARYSTSSSFVGVHIKDRGEIFVRKIDVLYNDLTTCLDTAPPSLVLLQACILIAYYYRSCHTTTHGDPWLVKPCVRLAYKLGLHRLDTETMDHPGGDTNLPSPLQWVSTEEKRRVWWSIWELDAFDYVLHRRAREIDHTEVYVNLPVSDEAWFAGKPTPSALFNFNLSQCWKALKRSENQDERAWFLISNYILVCAFDLDRQKFVTESNVEQLDTVVACFSLLVYEKLRTNLNSLVFDKNHYVKSNWKIVTQLMIQS